MKRKRLWPSLGIFVDGILIFSLFGRYAGTEKNVFWIPSTNIIVIIIYMYYVYVYVLSIYNTKRLIRNVTYTPI